MKIATLILSFLSFVLIPIAQAEQTKVQEFSASFKMAHETESQPEKYEKYSVDESGTSTILVSNVMVYLLKDDDGDEYYPKMTCRLDLDTNKEVNYYIISYLDFNDGYGWFIINESSVYTLDEGYSPEEGLLDLDLYFFSGYGRMKVNIKFEVYFPDGSLAATYGPDDDPDIKDILVESDDYDTKKDPFTTPPPTPSPTPTPAPAVDEIKLDNSELDGNRLILRKGKSIKISAEALSGGETIPDAEIEAEASGDAIDVSPSVATTDENGLAEFTITAKKKGNAKVSFTSGAAKKILRVKVK